MEQLSLWPSGLHLHGTVLLVIFHKALSIPSDHLMASVTESVTPDSQLAIVDADN